MGSQQAHSDSLYAFARRLAEELSSDALAGAGTAVSIDGEVTIGDHAYTVASRFVRRVDKPADHSLGCASAVAAVAVILVPVSEAQPHDALPDANTGRLTSREREIAKLLARRLTNAEIAMTLGISEHTVRHHVQRVLRKLGIRSRRRVAMPWPRG